MGCQGVAYCLPDCVKEGKAIAANTKVSSFPKNLYFCRRAGAQCESKNLSGASFETPCKQSPFYNLKMPSGPVKK
jgi:hypothetical protein